MIAVVFAAPETLNERLLHHLVNMELRDRL